MVALVQQHYRSKRVMVALVQQHYRSKRWDNSNRRGGENHFFVVWDQLLVVSESVGGKSYTMLVRLLFRVPFY